MKVFVTSVFVCVLISRINCDGNSVGRCFFLIIYYMKIGVFIDIRTALCTRNSIVTVITDHLNCISFCTGCAFCVNARAVK